MSRDKHKSRDRRLALLRRCVFLEEKCAKWGFRITRGYLTIHREGGMALANPDLQRLLKEGMLELTRGGSSGLAYPPKRFRTKEPSIHDHVHGRANVTRAMITEKGRRYLEEHELAFTETKRVAYVRDRRTT